MDSLIDRVDKMWLCCYIRTGRVITTLLKDIFGHVNSGDSTGARANSMLGASALISYTSAKVVSK